MTTIAGLVLWCAVYAGVVALLGVSATWALARRSPGAAATAAAGAVATILAATLLAPAPMPRLSAWAGDGTAAVGANNALVATARSDAADSASHGAGSVTIWRGIGERLAGAWQRAAGAVGAIDLPADAKPRAADKMGGAALVALVAAGAAIGVARLTWAWLYFVQLRRGSALVVNPAATALFSEVAAQLGVQHRIELRESAVLATPAVIGWRRPVVLLPAAHTGWSAEQLRAVLAHELAHAARGDFAWRAVAAAVRAVYFVHPLVRWLTARLALGQELAADCLAASASGGRETYLRALSELALRLDEPTRLRAAPLVMPAFSSNLTRRIAMLHTKDGSAASGRRSRLGIAAAALIALAGAGLLTLRGVAEEVPAAPAARTGSFVNPEPAAAFRAPPVDVSFLGPVDVALFVVRPSEFARRPDFAPATKGVEAFFEANMFADLSGEDPPGPPPTVRLAAIDYIAYSIRKEPEGILAASDADDTTQVVNHLETIDIAIRFNEPVELKPWLEAYLRPKPVEVVVDGVSYFTGPEDKPGDMFVAQRDANTVVLATSPERLVTLVKSESNAGESDDVAGFGGQWASVDGGLATVALNFEEMAPRDIQVDGENPLTQLAIAFLGVTVAEGEPNPINDAFLTIGKGTETICLGLDVDPAASDFVLRSSFACSDLPTAKQVRNSVELLQSFSKSYLQAMAGAGVGQMPDVFSQMYLDAMFLGFRMFGDAEVDFRLRGEDGVAVWLEGRDALPASFAKGIEAWAAMGGAKSPATVEAAGGEVQPAAAEEPIAAPAAPAAAADGPADAER